MPLMRPGIQPAFGQTDKRSPSSPLLSDLFFLLLLAAFYAMELLVIKPVDGINDDWGMYSILSGAYTGTPDAHVMFFLYPLSWLLAKLYTCGAAFPGTAFSSTACKS